MITRVCSCLLACFALAASEGALQRRQPTGIMGTTCTLVAWADTHAAVAAALAAAEAVLRDQEALFSTWREASPVSRLNAAPVGRCPAPAALVSLLARCHQIHAATGGAFDPGCGPAVALWRQAAVDHRLPSATAIDAACKGSSVTDFSPEPAAVIKHRADARLDLGGIAKGEAIDRAVAVLAAGGCRGGIVDLGGDLRVFGGRPDGGPWRVGIRSPWQRGLYGFIELADGAVATSGSYLRGHWIGGQRYDHVIDPRSGRPAAAGVASATVIAADTATADAWATALVVLGPAGLDRLPAGIEALLLPGPRPAATAAVTSPGFPLPQPQ